jgi:hypothetical protein
MDTDRLRIIQPGPRKRLPYVALFKANVERNLTWWS